MSATPEKCPTCGTSVPEGAGKCPGCGRVFGEENRCPHCHAIAPVRRRLGKTVCAACGQPRAGAVDMRGRRRAFSSKSRAGQQASTSAMMVRARGRTQRGFGVLTLAGGIAAAALAAALVPGIVGLGIAALGGAIAVGLGGLTIRAGARNMDQARRLEREVARTAIEELAAKHGGVLTAAQAAMALQVAEAEADEILTSMIGDGSEVDLEVDDEGVVTYVFHALRAPVIEVRVEVAEERGVEEPVEMPAELEVDEVAQSEEACRREA